ncbi:MAG: T9SS type A sorting domain-containing protein [candidate division WOR-3 bacterium]
MLVLLIAFNVIPLEKTMGYYRPLPPADYTLPETMRTMPKERIVKEGLPLEMDVVPGRTSGAWRAIEDSREEDVQPQDIGINLQGITFTYYIPPDVQIAVGTNHVIEMVNSHLAIYRKSDGAQVYFNNYYNFTGIPDNGTNMLYDPRIAYDIQANRWIITLDHTDWNRQITEVVLMVSVDSNPFNGFYLYRINAALPNGTWADYPMLGFNTWGIFITTNQFTWGGAYSTSLLFILDKASAYSGGPLTGSYTNATQPAWRVAMSLDVCNTAFLVKSLTGSGNVIRAWKITGSASAPVFSPQYNVAVALYSAPPSARQPGPNDNIDAGDARLQDVTFKGGSIFATLGETRNWGSGNSCAIRYIRIDTTTMTAAQDLTYGSDAVDYYYGRVSPENACESMVFTRSSNTEFASVYVTTKALGAPSFPPSTLIKAGEASYYLPEPPPSARNRWGDYSGVYMDPTGTCVWAAGEYAMTPSGIDRWGTWIVRFSCNPLYEGVEEKSASSSLLYSGGWLYYSLPDEGMDVRVYDVLGRMVWERRLSGAGRVWLDIGSGVYFVRAGSQSCKLVHLTEKP